MPPRRFCADGCGCCEGNEGCGCCEGNDGSGCCEGNDGDHTELQNVQHSLLRKPRAFPHIVSYAILCRLPLPPTPPHITLPLPYAPLSSHRVVSTTEGKISLLPTPPFLPLPCLSSFPCLVPHLSCPDQSPHTSCPYLDMQPSCPYLNPHTSCPCLGPHPLPHFLPLSWSTPASPSMRR